MQKGICDACQGTEMRAFPTREGLEDFPCPTCRPWSTPFGGERAGHHWVTEPALAGASAKYNGFPERGCDGQR